MPSVLWFVVMTTPQTLKTECSRMFFSSHAQHIGRRGRVHLQVLVERVPVDVAEIARLADAKDRPT